MIIFYVPIKTDKLEIIKDAFEVLKATEDFSESEVKMYNYAIRNELVTPTMMLAIGKNINYMFLDENIWSIGMEVGDYLVNDAKINHNHKDYYDLKCKFDISINLHIYSRFYGDGKSLIINNYNDFDKVFNEGVVDNKFNRINFNYDEAELVSDLLKIKEFFNEFPNGSLIIY